MAGKPPVGLSRKDVVELGCSITISFRNCVFVIHTLYRLYRPFALHLHQIFTCVLHNFLSMKHVLNAICSHVFPCFFHNLHIINAGPWKSHIGPKRFLGYPMELPPLDGRRSLATGVYIGLCVVPPAKEKGVKSEPWGRVPGAHV